VSEYRTHLIPLSKLDQIVDPTIPNKTVSCNWLDLTFEQIQDALQELATSSREIANQASWQKTQRDSSGVFGERVCVCRTDWAGRSAPFTSVEGRPFLLTTDSLLTSSCPRCRRALSPVEWQIKMAGGHSNFHRKAGRPDPSCVWR